MSTPNTQAYLLWDGARSFILSKVVGGPIDVFKCRSGIADILARKGESPSWRTHLFTPCDPKNVGQRKYIETFEQAMSSGDEDSLVSIHKVQPWEVDVCNAQMTTEDKTAPRHLSFSAQISFFLGAYWAGPHPRRLMIVSDSFDLAEPVLTCVDAGIPVSLIWFGLYLDTRWKSVLQQTKLEFLDLAMMDGLIVEKDQSAASTRRALDPW